MKHPSVLSYSYIDIVSPFDNAAVIVTNPCVLKI